MNKLEITQLISSKTDEQLWDSLENYVTIYDPMFFIEFGFSKKFIESLTHKYESDPSHWKSTIMKDGEEVKETFGVMATSVVSRCCTILGMSTTDSMKWNGRGRCHRDMLNRVINAVRNDVHTGIFCHQCDAYHDITDDGNIIHTRKEADNASS